MPNFDQFISEIKSGIVNLAKQNIADVIPDATNAGNAFIESTKADLQRWTIGLAAGQCSVDEFKSPGSRASRFARNDSPNN